MNSDAVFSALMLQLAVKLNVTEHTVRSRSRPPVDTLLAAGGDVEGHYSPLDGRFYVLDLARYFPPVPPRKVCMYVCLCYICVCVCVCMCICMHV